MESETQTKQQQMALADALRRRMEERGETDMASVSVRAGLGRSFVRDVLVGRSGNPGIYSLARVCEVLRCSLAQLVEESGIGRGAQLPDDKLRTKRLLALCWSAWGDNVKEAARHLQIDVAVLKSLEAGQTLAGAPLIEKALAVTKCPAHWISEGRLTGMPLQMSVLLGSYDLSLVRFDPDDEPK